MEALASLFVFLGLFVYVTERIYPIDKWDNKQEHENA
jgi:hypothetical protein